MTKAALRLSLPLFSLAVMTSPSFAHHPMGGETPTSWVEGVLSGLAHPVIGLDHLAFIVAVGVLAAIARTSAFMPLAFVAGTLAGCLAAIGGVELAATEWLVLGSLLLVGLALAMGHRRFGPLEAGIVAFAGLFHGMAYAGGILGAETSPLLAYLLGFTVVQAAIALGVMAAVSALLKAQGSTTFARIAGGAVLGIGLAFTVEGVEALIFPAVA